MQVHASIPAPSVQTGDGLRFNLRASAGNVVAHLLRWHDLARQRRALLTLDDHMLKDIGISRAEAEHEAARPFWQDRIGA